MTQVIHAPAPLPPSKIKVVMIPVKSDSVLHQGDKIKFVYKRENKEWEVKVLDAIKIQGIDVHRSKYLQWLLMMYKDTKDIQFYLNKIELSKEYLFLITEETE